MSSQPSLFTRLSVVEAELSAMKDIVAELQVSQDALRQDRDEWRWRAERFLVELQRGAWWRWRRRADQALDAVTSWSCALVGDARNKLSDLKASPGKMR